MATLFAMIGYLFIVYKGYNENIPDYENRETRSKLKPKVLKHKTPGKRDPGKIQNFIKRMVRKYPRQTDSIKLIGDDSTLLFRKQIMKDVISPFYS